MRLIAKRINIRHQLIAQPKILLQDRLRLFPIRPNLVIPAAPMSAEVRLKRPILKPPRIQLGIVIVPAHVIPSIRRIEQRRMRRMMHLRQILPTPDIISPISNPRSRNIQPGRNLPPQRIPIGINIRRPENRPIMLCPGIRVPGKNQRPVRNIPPETVIDRRRMKQRINIVIPRTRSNRKVTAIGWKIRLRLIRPDRIKTFADDIVPHHPPEPLSRRRIGRIDIRTRHGHKEDHPSGVPSARCSNHPFFSTRS